DASDLTRAVPIGDGCPEDSLYHRPHVWFESRGRRDDRPRWAHLESLGLDELGPLEEALRVGQQVVRAEVVVGLDVLPHRLASKSVGVGLQLGTQPRLGAGR